MSAPRLPSLRLANRPGAVVSVLLAALLWLAGAGPARAFLPTAGDLANQALQTVLAQINDPGVFEIRLGRVSLDGGTLRLDSLTVADSEGVWFQAGTTRLDWSWRDALGGVARFRGIDIESVTILRPPVTEDGAEPPAPPTDGFPTVPGLADWPRAPIGVRVDRLVLHRAALEPPVLGRAATARIEASFRDVGDEQSLTLVTETLEDQPARLDLDWRLGFDRPRLALDLALLQPAGGPFGAAAGLPPDLPLRVTLQGDGALPGWHGRLSADAGAYGDLLADLAVEADTDASWIVVSATGSPGAKLPRVLHKLLGARPSLGLRAGYQPGSALSLSDLSVHTRVAKATGHGLVTLPDTVLDADLTVRLLDPSALAALIAPVSLAGAEAQLELTGPLSAPLATLTATVAETRLDEVLSIAETRLTGRLEGSLNDARLVADAVLDGLGPAPIAAALGERVSLRLAAKGDPTRRITLTDARLETNAGHAQAAGVYDLETGTLTGDADATLPALARFAPLLSPDGTPLPLSGSARLQIAARDFGAIPSGPLTVTGRLADLTAPEPVLAALLGPAAALDASARWTDPETLALGGRLVTDGGAEATLDGTLSPAAGTGALAYRLGLTALSPVARAAGLAAAGALSTEGRLSGALADPSLDGRAQGRGLVLKTVRLGTLSADYRLQRVASAPAGRIDATLRGATLPVTLSTELDSRDGGLALDALVLRSGDNRLSGNLALPAGAALRGDLRLAAPSLGALLRPFGVPVGANAEGQVRLGGDRHRQTADLTLGLRDLVVDGAAQPVLTLSALDLQGSATQPLAGAGRSDRLASVTLSARAENGRIAGERLDDAQLSVAGALDALETGLDAHLAGPSDGSLSLRARVDAANPSRVNADLTVLAARYGDLSATLKQPARLSLAPERQSLEDLALDLGSGTLAGDVSLTPEALRTDLTLTALPLGLVHGITPTGLETGRLDGTLSFVGGGPDAGGRLDATLSELAVNQVVDSFRLDGRLRGRWDGRRAEASAQLKTPDGSTDLALSGGLDLRADPAGPVPQPPADAALEALLRWTGEITPIWALVPAPDHLLSGRADLEARVAGTLAAPTARGHFTLSEGVYENLLTGTILKALSLQARLTDDLTVPWTLSATDGGPGRLTGSGTVKLAGDPLAESRAEIEADRLLLVRRDDVTARGAGQVTLTPAETGTGARLTGRFETRQVEVRLVNALPPEIVAIDVIRSDQPPQPEAEAAPAGPPIALDLTLSVPGRAFVRGRGADMEWRGEVTVTGPAAAPVVQGRFEALQGVFDFIGNPFTLESGTVVLPRQGQPRVDLDFVRTANDITGHVLITGTAASPNIRFRSEPELPESEVLPRLLFGESQQSLGAAEALTLAQGLETLASGQPGLADRLRRSLRLDVLRFDAADGTDAAPTITVGRRIDKNVFVGARQPTSGESGSVFVEIEVFPEVKLQTELGATGESDASLIWEYKY